MKIIMHLIITRFSTPNYAFCQFLECTNGCEFTSHRLPLAEALKMMWELKLAGADKTVTVNIFDPTISTIDIHYEMRV